ncbi:MAG: hypothetical protein R3E42_00815 [Burkholderiaceae bacterium]
MAKARSKDPGSASNRGDLGYFGRPAPWSSRLRTRCLV